MDLEKEKNKDSMKMAWANIESKFRKIKLGGGKSRLEKIKSQGKLSARERVKNLVDDPDTIYEIGILAGEGMYKEYGGCPSAGVIVVIGKVSGRYCVIVANDPSVKAGAWFPMTTKKI